MKYTIAEIEKRVYALLDEIPEILEELTEYSDPASSLHFLISELLPEAAAHELRQADSDDIDDCESLNEEERHVSYDANGMGLLPLPENFLRLLYFKMSDWSRGVSSMLTYGSEEHSLRYPNPYRGRGVRRAPAVACRNAGKDSLLEIFGSQPSARVEEFRYVGWPELQNGQICLPRRLYGKICERLATMIKEIVN